MDFYWAGDNAIDEGDVAGSIALSPVLKRHNAYLVHNETVYCNDEDEWRGTIYLNSINSKRQTFKVTSVA